MTIHRGLALSAILCFSSSALAADGNRLTYLDELNPYYPSLKFPKLITPQWVGEEGVEAVVILGIDDMRGHEKWEKFLRPILERLKKIDGRAPVSIMTCQIDPKEPHLQKWLKEGLSLETHTIDHPCPLLANNDFAKAKSTYDRCVDLMNSVPGNKPVAFRMPCCDSLNTLSPRFFAEIFNRTTTPHAEKKTPRPGPLPQGERGKEPAPSPLGGEGRGEGAERKKTGDNFLAIDTSVFNVLTSNDPDLPRELVIDADGRDKFLKYIPGNGSFGNTIENYPYPYVIGKLCWEFPCATPSDWQAQNLHGSSNPATLRDWKALLDCTVQKQGVLPLVFHPHGWCTNEQIVDFIDYAVKKHGKKVKFLTFKEALERLNKHLLLTGMPLRDGLGRDNGVRLLDLNNDGYLDLVVGCIEKVKPELALGLRASIQKTRLWLPQKGVWQSGSFPVAMSLDSGPCFGIITSDGFPSLWFDDVYQFDDSRWRTNRSLHQDLRLKKPAAFGPGSDFGRRFRDLDGDGICEFIVSNEEQAIFARSPQKNWKVLPFVLPPGARIVDEKGRDAGLRFIDLNEDGYDDIVFSNEKEFGVYLFASMKEGWSRKVLAGKRGDPNELPMISRAGSNNGFWVHSRALWWQNEDTAAKKDLVDRRTFKELLANVEPEAKSPAASLSSIKVRPGFQVELVAAEPLVQDPVAFDWGPDGKFWVVEMGDYPLGVDGKGKPGGKIKYLEDTDGDGKYDKATTFLENVPFPTGVMAWKKGVLVTSAPEIFYAEHRALTQPGSPASGVASAPRVNRVTLYTGFHPGNQQHRLNGLSWGLDNWVYGANGDSGGKVKSLKTGTVVDIRGRDFRIRPDEGLIDPQSGQTQFGRSRDDWGNWFGCNNPNPGWHYVLDDRYQRRNPHVAAPDPRVNLSITPGAAQVYPESRTLPRFNDPSGANHFTSANSVIVYRDDLFGPVFANNTFVSEPVHNLIHREIMAAEGITFKSRRAADEQRSEFLASSDNWFRPTTIKTGPDGALWIADMYRHVIEHPEWIPKDWQKRLDLRAGHDKGRIYRVYPVGKKPRAIPRLDNLKTEELVAALDSPNGWQRDTVQRLLVHRQDKAAISLLEKLIVTHTPHPDPLPQGERERKALCRLHALCTLDGLGGLQPAILLPALKDEHPGVRRHAVRLCELHLAKSPELGQALIKLVKDADAQVRLQLAYTLGEWDHSDAGKVLGQLAVQAAQDRYFTAAVMSSVNKKNIEGVLLAVLADNSQAAQGLVENLLRLADSLGNTKALVTLLTAVSTLHGDKWEPWQSAALAGLLDTLDQRGTSLQKLQQTGSPEVKAAIGRLTPLFEAARATFAKEKTTTQADKLSAIRLLGRGLDQHAGDLAKLSNLLVPQTDEALQAASVIALGRLRNPDQINIANALLVEHWKGYGPTLRTQVLDVLLTRAEGAEVILSAFNEGLIQPFEVDAARRQRLLDHKNADIRKHAAKVFAGAVNADRQKVIEAYRPALGLKGDAGRGTQLFAKHCAACHKFKDAGQEVGPDLASLGDKTPESLLVAMLDPNRAVEAKFINYYAITRNGLTLTGVLASETGNSITLVGVDGKKNTILRADLDELASSGKSAMPEGLEKDVKPQDLADLIEHIRSGSPPAQRKIFVGNKPEVVKPAGDGSLALLASNCEIYGPNLVLESKHGNLGYWQSEEDYAVWTVDVPKAGKYVVWLNWACEEGSAGKMFVLQAGPKRLTGKVQRTGTWDDYKQLKVGEIALQAGQQQMVLRSAGKITEALMDLKGIRLVPETKK